MQPLDSAQGSGRSEAGSDSGLASDKIFAPPLESVPVLASPTVTDQPVTHIVR
jgi:hypothetical protein